MISTEYLRSYAESSFLLLKLLAAICYVSLLQALIGLLTCEKVGEDQL